MAIRTIREMGDPVLNKVSKEVKELTPRTIELIDDMFETMYDACGVGLAAPQVGILKRIVVIDTTGEDPICLINPRIVETDGEQTGHEGCLSVPGKTGIVTRPNYVKVVALDEDMNEIEVEGTELLARALCHEIEHLDGHLYVEKVEGELMNMADLQDDDEEDYEQNRDNRKECCNLKIIYMGTPDFSVGALEAMIEAGHEITAVVTQPDKPKGRGKEMQMTPVKECALKHGIPVLQPVKIKTPEAIAELRQYEADAFVVAAFGQIISKEILEMPRYGCINIHASLLPKYRGAAPIQRVILDGETETGVTIMQMDEGIDTGDMLMKTVVPIDAKDTGETLHDKLAAAGAKLIVEALREIEAGNIHPEKQDDSKSCYAKMLSKSLGLIDWNQEAVVIERLIRGLNSWPSAYTYLQGKTMKIWEAEVLEEKAEGAVGTVAAVTKDAIVVNTGVNKLKITTCQLEGKKRIYEYRP